MARWGQKHLQHSSQAAGCTLRPRVAGFAPVRQLSCGRGLSKAKKTASAQEVTGWGELPRGALVLIAPRKQARERCRSSEQTAPIYLSSGFSQREGTRKLWSGCSGRPSADAKPSISGGVCSLSSAPARAGLRSSTQQAANA